MVFLAVASLFLRLLVVREDFQALFFISRWAGLVQTFLLVD
jgi:hypothetical protein